MKFLRILYVQVIIGIVLGILAGFIIHDLPADQKAGWVKTAKLVSDTFINMIRMMIVPIIFFTIILGIVGAGNMKKVGRVGGKARTNATASAPPKHSAVTPRFKPRSLSA